jgi:hypothetical protein
MPSREAGRSRYAISNDILLLEGNDDDHRHPACKDGMEKERGRSTQIHALIYPVLDYTSISAVELHEKNISEEYLCLLAGIYNTTYMITVTNYIIPSAASRDSFCCIIACRTKLYCSSHEPQQIHCVMR